MSNKIRNIDFKTFITSYIPNFYSEISKEYSPEPIQINFEDTRFLFAVDWYRSNLEELEEFVSSKVFNSYVQKFWLDQEDNRICITLTEEKYRD
jgi:hypothetical protein